FDITIIRTPPLARDASEMADMRRAAPAKLLCRKGAQPYAPKRWIGVVEIDACDTRIEPFSDRTERIVVERIHVDALEAALRGPAVPTLPDRGCAVANRKAPGRITLLQQKIVGLRDGAGFAQNRADMPQAQNAGLQMPVRLVDDAKQMGDRRL